MKYRSLAVLLLLPLLLSSCIRIPSDGGVSLSINPLFKKRADVD